MPTPAALAGFGPALAACLREFDNPERPFANRLAAVAFSNGVYLAAKHPGEADVLRQAIAAAGISVDLEAVVAAFRAGIDIRGDWVAASGDAVLGLAARAGIGGDAFPLFAIAAGLAVDRELPYVADEMVQMARLLNSESHYLGVRLIDWCRSGWAPRHPPFVEFAAAWYQLDSQEWVEISQALALARTIALAQPERWSCRFWAAAGWEAGRVTGADPARLRRLCGEVPAKELESYFNLFRSCVIRTAAHDGTLQPERAALRYFANAARDCYARIYCRGDQPRYVARVTFDFTFWMALLSHVPLPAPAR